MGNFQVRKLDINLVCGWFEDHQTVKIKFHTKFSAYMVICQYAFALPILFSPIFPLIGTPSKFHYYEVNSFGMYNFSISTNSSCK